MTWSPDDEDYISECYDFRGEHSPKDLRDLADMMEREGWQWLEDGQYDCDVHRLCRNRTPEEAAARNERLQRKAEADIRREADLLAKRAKAAGVSVAVRVGKDKPNG